MEEEFVITFSRDGSQWCALWGENLAEGCSGFGSTKAEALRDLVEDLEEHGVI